MIDQDQMSGTTRCPHDDVREAYQGNMTFIADDPRDLAWCAEQGFDMNKTPDGRYCYVVLCRNCVDSVPTEVEKRKKLDAEHQKRMQQNHAELIGHLDELINAVMSGETVRHCPDCDDYHDESDCISKTYECGECGEFINGDEYGHRCSDCNKFCSKAHEHGCPTCIGVTEEVTLEQLEEARADA